MSHKLRYATERINNVILDNDKQAIVSNLITLIGVRSGQSSLDNFNYEETVQIINSLVII